MTKKGLMRNRGVSIAAAAVSAALVAPLVVPVGNPTLTQAFAQENNNQAPADGAENPGADSAQGDLPTEDPNGNPIIWADAITNGYVDSVSNMQLKDQVFSGRSFEVTEYGLITGTGLPATPAGTTIYMQWIDTDGAVSPYYAAKIHDAFSGSQGGEGTYAFDMREPWVDANGQERTWSAESGKKYRLWIPAYERDGVKYTPIRQVDSLMPGAFQDNRKEGNGSVHFGNRNKQRTRMIMGQEPQVELMTTDRDTWVESTLPVDNKDKDTVHGRVWKEAGTGLDRTNIATGPNMSKGDIPFEGATVLFSKLTPEGKKAYDEAVNSIEDQSARTAAAVEFLKNNRDAIAYTHTAKTDKDGYYAMKLPEGAIQDIRAWKVDDIWMGVLDEEGNPLTGYSPWMVPQFHDPLEFDTMLPGVLIPNAAFNRLGPINFATLTAYDAGLNITNYNTTDKPAAVGDVAELELTGNTLLPLDNWIEWRDKDGNVVAGGFDECRIEGVEVAKVTLKDECKTFKVPETAKPGDVYTAFLLNGAPGEDAVGNPLYNEIAADSFVVAAKQNAEFQPEYEKTDAPQGQETTVPAPKNTQPGEDGKVPPLPEGTKFSAPEDAKEKIQGPSGPVDAFPGDLTINEDGSIKVKPNDDAPLGEYKVPVLVTYPDGSKETIHAPINVTEGFTKPEDNGQPGIADEITPSWENQKTEAGKPVTAPNVGEKIPDGSKVEASSDKGWKTEVKGTDVTVTPPASAKPGDKSTIWVKVTYPDGSEDVEKFTVTVVDPNNPGDQATETTPDWKNAETKPNQPVDVPNTGDKLPEGSKVEAPREIDGWKIETGPEGKAFDTVRVTPPADAKPGDKIEVPVTVTYPDGSVDNETFTVTVKGDYEVKYNDAKGQPGTTITATPESLKHDLPASTRYAQGPEKDDKGVWKIDAPNETTGAIDATVSMEDLAKKYQKRWGDVCEPGGLNTKEVTEFVKDLMEATSSADVTFTAEEKQDNVPAKFILTDKDGNNLADNNDWDGDGVDNQTEIENCSNPLDPNDKPKDKPTTPIADTVTPDWKDQTTKPGTPVDVPNEGEKLPEGSKVDVPENIQDWKIEVKPDGETITVTPPADAKPGDKITIPVEVTYPDGSKDTDEFTVTVGQPDEKPNWDDKTTWPGTPVDVPNTGADVPESATVEVDGPGTAELKPDGTITVTPNKDAKPGDKIVVTVKDKGGNEIDTTTVTIVEKPNWDDTTAKPGEEKTIPNTGGKVPEGATVDVKGPGSAKLNPDGSLTVTPNKDAKPGDKIVVTVKDKDGKVIDTVTVTVDKPDSSSHSSLTDDERQRCIATSLGFGLPLAALVPLGLALRMNIPGLTPVVDELSLQIQSVNNDLQRNLNIFNPQAARTAQEIDIRLRSFGIDLATAGAGLLALLAGIATISAIASACTPGDGSSIEDIENGKAKANSSLKGSSGSSEPGSSAESSKK